MWYQRRKIISLRKRKFRTMLPRRRKERPIVHVAMEEEMRQLCARLDTMEIEKIRAHYVGDANEIENENVDVEEFAGEQADEE
jgi:hypothetical protein